MVSNVAKIDLRECLNAISDVVVNRPPPVREFDQIYMKIADMLMQTEYASNLFDARRTVFVGDGDAIALCLVHLHQKGLLEKGPEYALVLDFDERVVNSVRSFSARFGITERMNAELYNVADPVPGPLWQSFDAFYTNPPYGGSNGGTSVQAFLQRAIEVTGPDAVGCAVVADSGNYPWCAEVLKNTQDFLLRNALLITELQPNFHHYHLEDAPDLTSCNIAVRKQGYSKSPYESKPLDGVVLMDFYGKESPLRVRYVRDLRGGGKYPSRDYKLEPLDSEIRK
jgi:predicted methyltransferase